MKIGDTILGKHEEEVTVSYTGYVSIHIKTDHHEEAEALLFEYQALQLIEQLQKAIDEMIKDKASDH